MSDPHSTDPSQPTQPKISGNTSTNNSTHKAAHYPNPPDKGIPDAATLREQWKFAIRQYSRWYSQAWGTAILAGVSFFALGWIIKGGNPLPSTQGNVESKAEQGEADGSQKR